MKDLKIPVLERLKSEIDRIEKATGISVRDHLGFGKVDKPLQSFLLKDGHTFVGDQSTETKMPLGRGILIYSDGVIHIGYFEGDSLAPGNDVIIGADGMFSVGDIYVN